MPSTPLHSAVEAKNSLADIEALLAQPDQKIEIDAVDDHRKTALALALDTKQFAVATYLYSKSADLSKVVLAIKADAGKSLIKKIFIPWLKSIMQLFAEAEKQNKWDLNQLLFKFCREVNAYLISHGGMNYCAKFLYNMVYKYSKDILPDLANDENHEVFIKQQCEMLDLIAQDKVHYNNSEKANLLLSYFVDVISKQAYQNKDIVTLAKLLNFFEFCDIYDNQYSENDYVDYNSLLTFIIKCFNDPSIRALFREYPTWCRLYSSYDATEQKSHSWAWQLYMAKNYASRAKTNKELKNLSGAISDYETAIQILEEIPLTERSNTVKLWLEMYCSELAFCLAAYRQAQQDDEQNDDEKENENSDESEDEEEKPVQENIIKAIAAMRKCFAQQAPLYPTGQLKYYLASDLMRKVNYYMQLGDLYRDLAYCYYSKNDSDHEKQCRTDAATNYWQGILIFEETLASVNSGALPLSDQMEVSLEFAGAVYCHTVITFFKCGDDRVATIRQKMLLYLRQGIAKLEQAIQMLCAAPQTPEILNSIRKRQLVLVQKLDEYSEFFVPVDNLVVSSVVQQYLAMRINILITLCNLLGSFDSSIWNELEKKEIYDRFIKCCTSILTRDDALRKIIGLISEIMITLKNRPLLVFQASMLLDDSVLNLIRLIEKECNVANTNNQSFMLLYNSFSLYVRQQQEQFSKMVNGLGCEMEELRRHYMPTEVSIVDEKIAQPEPLTKARVERLVRSAQELNKNILLIRGGYNTQQNIDDRSFQEKWNKFMDAIGELGYRVLEEKIVAPDISKRNTLDDFEEFDLKELPVEDFVDASKMHRFEYNKQPVRTDENLTEANFDQSADVGEGNGQDDAQSGIRLDI